MQQDRTARGALTLHPRDNVTQVSTPATQYLKMVRIAARAATDFFREWAAHRNPTQKPAVIRVTFTLLEGTERLGHVDLDLDSLRRLRDLAIGDTDYNPPTSADVTSRPKLHLVGGDR